MKIRIARRARVTTPINNGKIVLKFSFPAAIPFGGGFAHFLWNAKIISSVLRRPLRPLCLEEQRHRLRTISFRNRKKKLP